MANEFIVLVTIVATLIIKDASSLERGETFVTRSQALLQRLMAICEPNKEQAIVFRHRTFHPVYEDTDGQATGCFWSSSGEGGGVGQLVLEEVAPLGMRIQVGVRFVAPPNGKTARLTLKYDPTWMDLGHNDHPVAFLDPDGERVAYPSSDWDAMSSAYLVGFELLEVVNGGNLFDTRSKHAIRDRDIRLVRVQWAAKKAVEPGPVPKALQLLTVTYGLTIARGLGIISNATHLGLDFKPFIDGNTRHVILALFRKLNGKKLVFSVMLHDEQARAAQMPTEAQAATVRPSVREDITAHPEGIVRIAKKAQEILRAVKEEEVKFLYADARALFLQKEPEPTLWWLMHAIFILSHHRHQNFGWRRGSFGRWLVPFAEKDILHFDVIARITADGLHRMLELRDPVAQAWRRDKDVSGKDWAARLAEAAKCSPSTVYTRRGLWWKEHKINIALPQQFYSDVLHFGQSSTTRPENVTKMLTAVKGKDGDRLVQLYAAAQANFQRERVTILNPALLAPPLAMPLESPRDIRPDIIEDGDEASVSAAPASRPPKPAAINLKAPRVRKKPKRVKPAAPQKRAPPKPRGRPFPRIEED